MKKIGKIKISYILVEAEGSDIERIHAYDHCKNNKTPDTATHDEKLAKYYFWDKGCQVIQKPFTKRKFPKLRRQIGQPIADELNKLKRGKPDLFIYKGKYKFFLESKSEGFHLTKDQLLFAKESIKRNINYVVFKVMNKTR